MANFDTVNDNSKIMYGNNEDRFIVEWSKVTLRDNRKGILIPNNNLNNLRWSVYLSS